MEQNEGALAREDKPRIKSTQVNRREQFACGHHEVDLSPFTEWKWVVDGQLVPRE